MNVQKFLFLYLVGIRNFLDQDAFTLVSKRSRTTINSNVSSFLDSFFGSQSLLGLQTHRFCDTRQGQIELLRGQDASPELILHLTELQRPKQFMQALFQCVPLRWW